MPLTVRALPAPPVAPVALLPIAVALVPLPVSASVELLTVAVEDAADVPLVPAVSEIVLPEFFEFTADPVAVCRLLIPRRPSIVAALAPELGTVTVLETLLFVAVALMLLEVPLTVDPLTFWQPSQWYCSSPKSGRQPSSPGTAG
ncbi:hypothetical protein [Acidiphilium sp. C61]|uniref:hypothetical protein n=1 Tax=Acidiphilium sp. C61 TaxID=1671485 RepID=UPI00157BA416|nr:hypothetical protein [Acidiphilium sp. C61]